MRYSKKYSIVANGVENKWNKNFNIVLTGHKSNMVTTRAPPPHANSSSVALLAVKY